MHCAGADLSGCVHQIELKQKLSKKENNTNHLMML
jgi:hypothetical protein